MRYEDFRDRWQEALREAGLLFTFGSQPKETIELATTYREWKVFIGPALPQHAPPFYVSVELGFSWDPFQSARSYTSEEDLLTELHGRTNRPERTEPRYLRIDVVLHATLPYGSKTPLPGAEILDPWALCAEEALADSLPIKHKKSRGPVPAVESWRGEIKIEARCTAEGTVALEGVSLPAFELVRLPRMWDDAEQREREPSIGGQLDRLARRAKTAFDVWTAQVGELAQSIQSAATTKPREPAGVADRSLEIPGEGDEPETTH